MFLAIIANLSSEDIRQKVQCCQYKFSWKASRAVKTTFNSANGQSYIVAFASAGDYKKNGKYEPAFNLIK